MNKIIDKIKNIEHGFKEILTAGDIILADTAVDHTDLAKEYLKDERCQIRMLATHILGQLSPNNPEALLLLETKVATDNNWRVQEMLAKAFDYYCRYKGYQESLPTIERWFSHKNPNIRRAVVEGLRIWTGRPFFKDNPNRAIQLIAQIKSTAGESDYLVRSIGNALRDIRKTYPDLVALEVSGWELTDKTLLLIKKLIEK